MIPRPMSTNVADYYHLAQALAYRNFAAGGLAASVGTNTRPKTVNTVQYCAQLSGGQLTPVLASKAATDPLPDWTAAQKLIVLTATQTVRVRIEVDKAGTVTYKIGGVVAAPAAQAPMPRRTAGLCTLGWIEIDSVAGGFTFGTTSLASAGVTFFDGDPDLSGIEGVAGPQGNPDRGISTDVVSAP